MSVVLPGRGWVEGASTVAGATGFVLLGPFAFGDTIIRVVYECTADVALVCRFAGSLGISAQANQASMDAGSPLVWRSDGRIGSVPGVPFRSLVNSPVVFWLPVGVQVVEAPKYIVCATAVGAGTGTVYWSASAEVVLVR